jgi:hypothetical protein
VRLTPGRKGYGVESSQPRVRAVPIMKHLLLLLHLRELTIEFSRICDLGLLDFLEVLKPARIGEYHSVKSSQLRVGAVPILNHLLLLHWSEIDILLDILVPGSLGTR